MPRFDRTGPLGRGPLTGRGRGFCMDRGFGGFRRFSREDETKMLKEYAEDLKEELKDVEEYIKELES